MGRDIHAWVEYALPDGHKLCAASIEFSRNYTLFDIMYSMPKLGNNTHSVPVGIALGNPDYHTWRTMSPMELEGLIDKYAKCFKLDVSHVGYLDIIIASVASGIEEFNQSLIQLGVAWSIITFLDAARYVPVVVYCFDN